MTHGTVNIEPLWRSFIGAVGRRQPTHFVENPATAETVAEVALASPEAVDAAVRAAALRPYGAVTRVLAPRVVARC